MDMTGIVFLANPNDNGKNEFSDGPGDEQLDIHKIELYDDETDKLLEKKTYI